MFRKLFPWAMAALIVVLAIAGCSKKPTDYEKTVPVNYAPSGMTAFPDTNNVVIKWTLNAEAESQSGFGGYYVYCTSRYLTGYQSASDSIVGLAQLPAESLQYFQVPGCPFPKGVDSVVVTVDPTDGKALVKGTKYYFYVRSLVDGQLSWAGNWVMSCPRPIGYGTIYAYDLTDLTNGKACGFAFKDKNGLLNPTTYTMPTLSWKITYVDSTPLNDIIPGPVRTTYSKRFVAEDELNPLDSLIARGLRTTSPADTSVTGFVEWDSLHTNFKTVWKTKPGVDTLYPLGIKAFDIVKQVKYDLGSVTNNATLLNNIDLVLERVAGTTNQVRLACPLVISNIPSSSAWSKGRETFIQDFPSGYDASIPDVFSVTSYGVVLTLGETGNVYQVNVKGNAINAANNYAKIKIDSVVTSGNTIKVCFNYAYQAAIGIKNF
ncbi:MAG: hypothetical protein Q7U71_09235 [bacterium]|nr:hypothetical protein [bacterium]